MSSLFRKFSAAVFLILSACGLTRCAPEPIDAARVEALYAAPLPPPEGPLSVYFVGHSLVGRTMPAMLAQLAGEGHRYESQLGWGAELQAHWEPDVPLDGGETENAHARFREAHEAVDSGDYEAIVLTEKIGLESSIKYHDSWRYLTLWTKAARAANPDVRVYLYETWHDRDREDWLARLDGDLPRLWEREIIDRALADEDIGGPIHVIPGGQVMAAMARALEAEGGVEGLTDVSGLFKDAIHFNDMGAYLMALTHYAVLYGRSPEGLPHRLMREDGTPADAPSEDAARLMQRVVWEVVTGYARTGVARG